MALVALLKDEEVQTDVLEAMNWVESEYGFKPNILRAIANCPELFSTFLPLWAGIYKSPYIDRRKRAILALGTAFTQDCEYCFGPMQQSALHAGLTMDEIDYLAAGNLDIFPAEERALFEYSKALTIDPSIVPAELTERMLEHFNDKELVNITLGVGMYNLTSRFLKGLQIDPDVDATVLNVEHELEA